MKTVSCPNCGTSNVIADGYCKCPTCNTWSPEDQCKETTVVVATGITTTSTSAIKRDDMKNSAGQTPDERRLEVAQQEQMHLKERMAKFNEKIAEAVDAMYPHSSRGLPIQEALENTIRNALPLIGAHNVSQILVQSLVSEGLWHKTQESQQQPGTVTNSLHRHALARLAAAIELAADQFCTEIVA